MSDRGSDLDLAISFLEQDKGSGREFVVLIRPDLVMAQLQSAIDKCEQEIRSLEIKIEHIRGSWLQIPSSFSSAIEDIQKEYDRVERRLEQCKKWHDYYLSQIHYANRLISGEDDLLGNDTIEQWRSNKASYERDNKGREAEIRSCQGELNRLEAERQARIVDLNAAKDRAERERMLLIENLVSEIEQRKLKLSQLQGYFHKMIQRTLEG